ncbi:GreA/GreB family elongation factor [Colwellia sp. E2M01]|nr:GreA/GreB family elongation factor [Colwellia sp. E2M01]MBU2870818.1 GreA/GreB family elongation factor [Colwellia sp. E2M01]
MIKSIFRSGKTSICPSNIIFKKAGFRRLSDPIAIAFMLDNLAFCQTRASRLQNRVRVGSTVILKNINTQEVLTLKITLDEKPHIEKGIISFSSILGTQLLGLRCGDITKTNTEAGQLHWEILTVNHH